MCFFMLHFFGLHKFNKKKTKYVKLNHAQDLFDSSDEPNERTPVRITFE